MMFTILGVNVSHNNAQNVVMMSDDISNFDKGLGTRQWIICLYVCLYTLSSPSLSVSPSHFLSLHSLILSLSLAHTHTHTHTHKHTQAHTHTHTHTHTHMHTGVIDNVVQWQNLLQDVS